MSTETKRLEEEAENKRDRLDNTLDALRGRLSLGDIVEEVSGYVKSSQGTEFVNNFGRQVRDNPLALGLVGAGMAWLFFGDTARSESSRLGRRVGEWRDNRAYDRFEEAFPPGGEDDYSRHAQSQFSRSPGQPAMGQPAGSPGRTGPARYGDPYGKLGPSSQGSETGSSGPGLGDKAREAGERAKAAGAGVGSRVSSAAEGARDQANRTMHDTRDRLRGGYDSVAGYGSDAYSYAGDEARHLWDGVSRGGRRLQRSFVDTLREEPLVVGAVALAIGAAVGAAMPSSRSEDRYLGAARDRLRDEALHTGRDLYERGEEVARHGYEAASEKAQEEGLMPSSNPDKTLAQKVENVGKAATNAAKEEADKKKST